MNKVFLDCGARHCDITRKHLKQGFTDWDFYLFEANPGLKKHYDQLIVEYPQINSFYLNKAVWIEDGETDFYFSRRGNSGSTIVKEKFSNKVDHDNPIKVETIDFSEWIENNLNKNDYTILKIDIEGAEYEVLGKMIDDGTIDYMNKIIVEWHGRSKMKCTQRHHDLYKKAKEYLTNSDIPVYNENNERIFE